MLDRAEGNCSHCICCNKNTLAKKKIFHDFEHVPGQISSYSTTFLAVYRCALTQWSDRGRHVAKVPSSIQTCNIMIIWYVLGSSIS